MQKGETADRVSPSRAVVVSLRRLLTLSMFTARFRTTEMFLVGALDTAGGGAQVRPVLGLHETVRTPHRSLSQSLKHAREPRALECYNVFAV